MKVHCIVYWSTPDSRYFESGGMVPQIIWVGEFVYKRERERI